MPSPDFPMKIFFLTMLFAMTTQISTPAQTIDVWIGSGGPEGIHRVSIDLNKGKLSEPTLVAEIAGSGFSDLHPTGKYLFSTGHIDGQHVVASFQIQRDGDSPTLKPINSQPISDGGSACIAVDRSGNVLCSAQYGGGSVATFPINADGSLEPQATSIEHGTGSGVDARRQAKAHPHWVGTSPDNRFLMVPDLGKDAVVIYKLEPQTAKLESHGQAALPPGAGPRHMKFHPNGKWAYVLNELDLTIGCFKYDTETADFEELEIVESLPKSEWGSSLNTAAEIRIHPNGKFLYSSNRGHDTISVFEIDQQTGKLKFVQREPVRGSWPRNFALDPSGNWLIAAGKNSNTLALFTVDPDTGRLEFTRSIVNSPQPICVLFDQTAPEK